MIRGTLFSLALLLGSCHGISPTKTEAPKTCQEDDPCWNCETMGNKVCGTVNAEIYRQGSHDWIRIWDERGRLVFGPVYLQTR